ncbi:DUF3180 family protein [Gulosibacter sp. 10]|uniref:DUF3180 family protein n=1 Tax=Gulosibacter sp. 10 TaxID=1255570 RepID=UPI00097F6495|nr:DUF3180 family protein [Gulosibacter sp. 10]SJM59684.1 secreted protein [Gulosibacter sp. 10]
MTRTNPWLLVLFALAGGAVTWAIETWLTAAGARLFVPAPPFGITLLVMAVVVLVVAWPVRRYTQALRRALDARAEPGGEDAAKSEAAAREAARLRVDPFWATFAVALAKAGSMAGSLFAGCGAAVIAWLATRTVVGGGVAEPVFAAVASAALVVAGLVAESWCALPPDDGAEEGAAEPV